MTFDEWKCANGDTLKDLSRQKDFVDSRLRIQRQVLRVEESRIVHVREQVKKLESEAANLQCPDRYLVQRKTSMNPMAIHFEVTGEPKAQPRPKAFARKFGNGAIMARVYTPGTAEEWKSQIAVAARDFVPMPPLQGPLRVDIEFRFSRPKAHFLTRGLRDNAPTYHFSRPDRDNLEKAVLDALTTIGMWDDDAQVCCGEIVKRYCNDGELAGARVAISPAELREKVGREFKQPALALA